MQKEKDNKVKLRDPLPESFDSISAAGDFWDNHDSMDYEDLMEDVELNVNIKRRVFMVPVAEKVFAAIQKKARSQGLSTETMLNLMLKERAEHQ